MAQKVWFAGARARGEGQNKVNRIRELFDAAGFGALVERDDLVAVKLHFGERGGDAHIRPPLVRQVVDKVRERGGKPFLTDTATLYSGSRGNAVDHVWTAAGHGFDLAVVGAPVIMADGLRGTNVSTVEINKKHFKRVSIASDIVSADCLIGLAHFKGHMQAGFGGAMKNLAMGCAPPAGKRDQHGSRALTGDNCAACGACEEACPEKAIRVVGKRSQVDKSRCSGCGECMTVCPNGNIEFDWETEAGPFGERLVEYACGSILNKRKKVGFINFLLSISPECDCVPWSDSPIVPDIGMLASTDPVALDKASYDLVNMQAGLPNSALKTSHSPGQDKFKDIWPRIDGSVQFRHAERIGLGTADYKLVEL
ncbi:MAG: DUF362 domain-containing protein [Euryarchaeota archaeon]|nr:DUF362 domain-containing protein [Euryarchaeota archaeon]